MSCAPASLPPNLFKAALRGGQRQIGLWSALCSNIASEIIAGAGFDWIVVDTEHAPNEIPGLLSQLQAMSNGTAEPVVRCAWNDAVLIKRILDVGARSLLVPFVQNAEEARRAVAAAPGPALWAGAAGRTAVPAPPARRVMGARRRGRLPAPGRRSGRARCRAGLAASPGRWQGWGMAHLLPAGVAGPVQSRHLQSCGTDPRNQNNRPRPMPEQQTPQNQAADTSLRFSPQLEAHKACLPENRRHGKDSPR